MDKAVEAAATALKQRHGLGSRTADDFRADAEVALTAADAARAVTREEVVGVLYAKGYNKGVMEDILAMLHTTGLKVIRG